MRQRERDIFRKPLSKRRGGKAILLKWAKQFVYEWAGEVKPEEISECDLNDFDCRIREPKCKRCWDTGHVGTGPAPPLTGIGCMHCGINERRQAEHQRVHGLEERIRQLESLLADRALGELN